MKSISRLPPPPQQINDYLNGHIIGHYVMKKALSVAIYNHYSNVSVARCGSRKSSQINPEKPEEVLVEDTKSVFNRMDGSSLGRMLIGLESNPPTKPVPKFINEMYDSPEVSEPSEYMTPVVTRVIIEASTHRVHLRKSNTLTFDSTGSSKPLGAIASTIAQFMDVPYVRCDCSFLNPVQQVDFNKREPKDGTLAQLLSGYCGETINSTISRLYRKADFDLERASRGVVFLDGMHKIGENQGLSKIEQQQVLREILQIVEGQVQVDVTRAGSLSMDREVLNTSSMFFICFGVFEAEEQLLNQEEVEYVDDFEVIEDADDDFKVLAEPNNNDVMAVESDVQERRDSRTLVVSMDTSSSSSSSEKSPELIGKRRGSTISDRLRNNNNNNNNINNLKTTQKPNVRKEDNKKLNHSASKQRPVVRSDGSDLSSTASSRDEWSDDWSDDGDDSFQGLKENKLAKLVTEAENSPIRHYQTLWGMKDVDLKFTPEALEIVANQAMSQQAGRDGVARILEKLFLTIKFDILGTDVVAVEITEDFVLGKSSPMYHYAHSKHRGHVTTHRHHSASAASRANGHHHNHSLCAILEEAPSTMSDYDQGIFEQLEI